MELLARLPHRWHPKHAFSAHLHLLVVIHVHVVSVSVHRLRVLEDDRLYDDEVVPVDVCGGPSLFLPRVLPVLKGGNFGPLGGNGEESRSKVLDALRRA